MTADSKSASSRDALEDFGADIDGIVGSGIHGRAYVRDAGDPGPDQNVAGYHGPAGREIDDYGAEIQGTVGDGIDANGRVDHVPSDRAPDDQGADDLDTGDFDTEDLDTEDLRFRRFSLPAWRGASTPDCDPEPGRCRSL